MDMHPKDILARWEAPEYEVYERGRRWYLYMTFALLAIIGYAIYSNSPVMAITFILIGVVEYIYLNKQPRIVDFIITPDGVVAGKEIYEFDHVHSFWIFYEPGHKKIISFHMKTRLMPYAHFPIENEDPALIRQILLKYIPEIKQEPSFVDTLERLLRI